MTKAMAALLTAAALLAALQGCASPPRPHPASDCGPGATCGAVRVPLDRSDPSAGTVGIGYTLVRHLDDSRPAQGTIVPDPGGPGASVTAALTMYATGYRDLLRTHDLLLVDPRGTGVSGPLRCRAVSGTTTASPKAEIVRAIGACGRELGDRSRHHTTEAAADDIDAVRAHLGIDRLDLLGQSYGTYLMTVYAQRHPEHVRSIVLSGAYPLRPDPWGRPGVQALRRAVEALCDRSRGACEGRAVLADLATVAARLRSRPVALDGGGALDEAALARLVYTVASDDPELFGRLPAMLHRAAAGETGPLAALAARTREEGVRDGEEFSVALFASVVCHDYPTPWKAGTPIRERAARYKALLAGLDPADFRPFSPRAWASAVPDRGDVCADWPGDARTPSARRLPDVPVLVVSGEFDLNTPVEEGRSAARRYPTAEVVTVPNSGHVPESGGSAASCVIALQARFIRTGRLTGAACLGAVPAVPVERL
ncbi:alpha/beta fold hydrolase [Microbispora sp. NPDC088329]|uniref:alpha/beta fold hydrolase n=1 Tax=Microbispora sp. NPDC088329 TaxID=3154869 RepID=UPI0034445E06